MSMSLSEKLSSPRLFIFITKTEDKKKLHDILAGMNIPIYYQCRGEGTAKSEIMDILGFGGTTRLLTMGFLPKFEVKELFEQMDKHMSFHQRGGGIIITIPITGLQSPLFHLLNDEAKEEIEKHIKERVKKDMAEVNEKSMYNLIWASVEAGYSDLVIDTARAAGAKGGTIMRGKRKNSEKVSSNFGISVQDEQDFVMIVVPKEKKSEIMSAICNKCGLNTPAHGIVISMPVDQAVGLEG